MRYKYSPDNSLLNHRSRGRTSWEGLSANDQVLVTGALYPPYTAIVDVISQNRTVVWVIATTGAGRRAFHYADEVTIEKLATS